MINVNNMKIPSLVLLKSNIYGTHEAFQMAALFCWQKVNFIGFGLEQEIIMENDIHDGSDEDEKEQEADPDLLGELWQIGLHWNVIGSWSPDKSSPDIS